MYGIDPALDLSSLAGQTLDGILLARGSVVFNFTESRISVQGPIHIRKLGRDIAERQENETWTTPRFAELLGLEVESFSIFGTDTLEIRFEDDLALRLRDNSTQYESFQIWLTKDNADLIIV